MKTIAILCLVVVMVMAQQPQPQAFSRDLPADVLRDFPGMCFASTACRVHPVGEKWSLAPFCGVAECALGEKGLIERVADCGPLPKPNEKCKISNPESINATFPDCCPKFTCADGAKLEFPTVAELAALFSTPAPTTS